MHSDIEKRLLESAAAFRTLSKGEQLSLQAAQAITYVASELFLGVIEDAGDFESKRASALQSLRWIEGALAGAVTAPEVTSTFLQRTWLLSAQARDRVRQEVVTIIAELENLDKSAERATRLA